MTHTRVLAVVIAVAAAGAGRGAVAQDAEQEYFATRFGAEARIDRVATASDGTIYVAGGGYGYALPVQVDKPDDPYAQSFLSAWSPDGRPRWSTYLPRRNASYLNPVQGLAAADDGSAWVAYDAYAPADDVWIQDVCLLRFAADGTKLVDVRLGGSREEVTGGLAVLPGGDAIVVGWTRSADFPASRIAPESPGGGAEDGFVARIAADGTGVVWAERIGGPGRDAVAAVCADGDGVLVVWASAPENGGPWDDDVLAPQPIDDLKLLRIGPDGEIDWSAPLPHATGGGVTSLATLPDGTVLAAGRVRDGQPPYGSQAFVARVERVTGAAIAVWKTDSERHARVRVTPSGDVVVGTDLRYEAPRPYDRIEENQSRVRLLGPDLRQRRTLVAADPASAVLDFAAAPDGSLCVAGMGPVPVFNAYDSYGSEWTPFLTRLPVPGPTLPGRVDAVTVRKGIVELRWDAGDAGTGWQVELLDEYWNGHTVPFAVAAETPAGARSVRVKGFRPGEEYRARLVAVAPSGVRIATELFPIRTDPPWLRTFSATTTPRGRAGVRLSWEDWRAGYNTEYRVERSIGGGPFRAIRPDWWSEYGRPGYGSLYDAIPPLGGAIVRYRVRAQLIEGHAASRWTYSQPVVTAMPTLRVRQTSGRMRRTPDPDSPSGADRRVIVDMTGTFEAIAGDTPRFESATDSLYFYFGDAGDPLRLRVPPGRFRNDDALGRSRSWSEYNDREDCYESWNVTVDFGRRTFSAHADMCGKRRFNARTRDVVVGLSYGDLVGGEIRRWNPAGDGKLELVPK